MNALLLYERRASDEEDRRGDLRWCVRADGAFFHARRDEPFPAEPARRFDGPQLERFTHALAEARLASLSQAEPPDEHTVTERWTVPGTTVEVYNDDEPAAIGALRAVVDRLVAESR